MQGSLFQIFINLLFTVANKCKLHLLLKYKNTVWKWRKSYVHLCSASNFFPEKSAVNYRWLSNNLLIAIIRWMNGNEWVITPSVTLGGSQCGKNFHGFFMEGPFFMEGSFFMDGPFFMEGPFLPAKRNFGIGF
ncbi:hypothetical protein T08_3089 [Trichinella sp. T8]|nr:hypothetical protein T08_3089 [Trichinella sp. T8]